MTSGSTPYVLVAGSSAVHAVPVRNSTTTPYLRGRTGPAVGGTRATTIPTVVRIGTPRPAAARNGVRQLRRPIGARAERRDTGGCGRRRPLEVVDGPCARPVMVVTRQVQPVAGSACLSRVR